MAPRVKPSPAPHRHGQGLTHHPIEQPGWASQLVDRSFRPPSDGARDREQVAGASCATRLGGRPDAIADDVAMAKWVADRGTATIDQRALAVMIESGRYDRHLRRMRTEYATR